MLCRLCNVVESKYIFVFVFIEGCLDPIVSFYNKNSFYFTDFLENRAEFPLFFGRPDNTSCRYFIKIQSIHAIYIKYANLKCK
ncbi:hypothetical protein Hanom_Chr00s000003g01603671 [Helianthus anomalus]